MKSKQKSTVNLQRAGQYYDYIDTSKAQENGIRLEDNYAYNNPSLTGKGKRSRRSRAAMYADPSQQRETEEIALKSNRAYLESKKKGKRSQRKSSGSKKAVERKTYASPLGNLSTNISSSSLATTQTPSSVEAPATFKPTESSKQPQERIEYAPPKDFLTTTQTETAKQTLSEETQKEPSKEIKETSDSTDKDKKKLDIYASPERDSALTGSNPPKLHRPSLLKKPPIKERKTYASPLDKIAPLKSEVKTPAPATDKAKKPGGEEEYMGPVVPSATAKNPEGIDLKQNYAYKVAKKAKQESYATPGEGATPAEEIALKTNAAYKAPVDAPPQEAKGDKKSAASKSKKRPPKPKPFENNDLRNAYN